MMGTASCYASPFGRGASGMKTALRSRRDRAIGVKSALSVPPLGGWRQDVPRDCKYVLRVKADQSEFSASFEAADQCAKAQGSDRWAEIQPGYMAFHFASHIACYNFGAYLTGHNLQLMIPEEGNDPGGSHDV
jgi:hypothetical protein